MKIVGHEKQWRFLKQGFESGTLSHGYLFSGEEKIGKKSLALELVKFIHCRDRNEGPCGECGSCLMIEKGTHPDFLFVEHEEGKDIKVDQVDSLRRHLCLRPSFSSRKTALIDDAHLLNRYGQNSLLKSLEEPSEGTILILVTHQPHLLFDTVLSRVQELRFFPLSTEKMINFLERKKISDNKRKRILEISHGRPGTAVDLIQDPSLLEKEEEREAQIKKLSEADLALRFKLVKPLSKQDLQPVLSAWLRYFRQRFLEMVSEGEETGEIKKAIDEIQRTLYLYLNTNVNRKILLQNLMLKI